MPKLPSNLLAAPSSGPLADVSQKVRKRIGHHRDGLLPIPGNKEALDYRLALIDSAVKTLDIQMFIWLDDLTGRLLLNRILQAADRGVRVRLLLDDFVLPSGPSDHELAAINTHPQVEVRIYNPFYFRGGQITRVLEMVTNPAEKNQRMHNKTIIADSTLAILSGRNIGDHCYGVSEKYNNIDLGVVASGPVIEEIGRGFDSFWQSEPSYNVAAFAPDITTRELQQYRQESVTKMQEIYRELGREVCMHPIDWSPVLAHISGHMFPGKARFVGEPAEVPSSSHPVIKQTLRMAAKARKDLIMENLYIVPDQEMLDLIATLKKRGVRVRLLVPSIGSNHNPVVFNQYSKYRKILLQLGMEIYELKGNPGSSGRMFLNEGPKLSQWVKLHAKSVVADDRYCYIGTLNLDGRSRTVNTEEGLIIDSPSFVRELRKSLEKLMLPENAWRVTLDKKGRLVWTSGNEVRRKEPTINRFQTILERILRPFDLNNAIFPDHQLYKRKTQKKR